MLHAHAVSVLDCSQPAERMSSRPFWPSPGLPATFPGSFSPDFSRAFSDSNPRCKSATPTARGTSLESPLHSTARLTSQPYLTPALSRQHCCSAGPPRARWAHQQLPGTQRRAPCPGIASHRSTASTGWGRTCRPPERVREDGGARRAQPSGRADAGWRQRRRRVRIPLVL